MPTIEMVGSRIWLRWKDGYVPREVFDRRRKQAESVVGASFKKQQKVYTYPLDMVICRDLRGVFGDDLEIGPKLWEWASVLHQQEKQLVPLLTAKDTDALTRVEKHAPLIWAAMNDGQHEYQKPAAAYCALVRRAQNTSQPGLGKTIETLAAIVEADIRGLILVAAPKTSLRLVWESEVKRWLPGVPVFACTGGAKRRTDTLVQAMKTWQEGKHSMVFVAVNPEMLRTTTIEECQEPGCGWLCTNHAEKKADAAKKQADEAKQKAGEPVTPHDPKGHKVIKWYEHDHPALFDQPWSAFVIDETHRYLLNVNLRTKRATQTGTGAMLIPVAEDAMKLALSGTPWKGKVKNAWAVAHWLWGDVGLTASFWNWANRMLDVDDNGFGKTVGGVRDEQEFNRWVDSYMIRHTKAEMAPFLPPKSYGGSPLNPGDPNSPIGVWLDFEDPKQERAYRQMEEDAATHLDEGTILGNGILAEFTRLKQFASTYGALKAVVVKGKRQLQFGPAFPSNKFDWTLQFLEERGITGDDNEEGDSKVVIASQFTKTLDLMAAEYERRGIKCFLLTGKQGDKLREEYVTRFQQPGGPRVFLINTMAGGVSVTLDAADDLVFMDETWVPDDQEQVEDRTHRTGRIHNVTIWYLRTRGTIDERIAISNVEADDVQKMLLDGKRGVEFARRLLGGK